MMNPDLKRLLEQEIQQRGLPDNFLMTVEQSYWPVAQAIAHAQIDKQDTLLVSFNGSQGSGKSTITAFLRLILTHQFDLFTVEASIDDFYHTREQRKLLANSIHPLFATRGVPGTHDVSLANETLSCLRLCSEIHPCRIPLFDKAIDDRLPRSQWPTVAQDVRVILFEGWCNHAPVQSPEALIDPVNDLERNEDKKAVWRKYANDQLEYYHRILFSEADLLVFLQVPSFEKVFEWRGLQEKKLAEKVKLHQSDDAPSAVMDEAQLKRFIQHYERITRACLDTLPEHADIVLKMNSGHGIDAVTIKQPRVDE